MDVILKRLAVLRVDGWANVVDSFRGALTILWGVIFVLGGMLMAAVVLMDVLVPGGAGARWRDWLLGSTGKGVLLSLAGMLLMLNGLIRALAGSAVATLARMGALSRAGRQAHRRDAGSGSEWRSQRSVCCCWSRLGGSLRRVRSNLVQLLLRSRLGPRESRLGAVAAIELRLVQLVVDAPKRQELGVSAAFDDAAAVHHQDQVGRQDGR